MLRMQLLGDLQVSLDGVRVPTPTSRRAWAVLAWLALHPGPHPRSLVASTFWPDVLDGSARASLRSAIWAIRQALGPATDRHLIIDREHIGLRPSDVQVDMAEVDVLIMDGRLEEAVAVGERELLPDIDEEWVHAARDNHRRRMLDVLESLAERADHAGDTDAGLTWTRRQVLLDPDADEPVRRLMIRLAASRDRTSAILVYERYRERLEKTLRTTPATEIADLADELRRLDSARELPAADRSERIPSDIVLIGRSRERARLLRIWRHHRAGGLGVVMITGDPGIGKTRIAAELRELVAVDGAKTATCTALDLGGAAPFGLWAELVGALVPMVGRPPSSARWPAVLSRLSPDLEARLGVQLPAPARATPDLERVRLFEAVVGLLHWASRQPVLLIFDDLHAADPASLDLIGHVARRLADRPILMILTRRPLPHRPAVDALLHSLRSNGQLDELELDLLGDDDVARMATAIADLPSEQINQIVRAAEGNALIATAWTEAMAHGHRTPPTSLLSMVRTSLRGLGDEACELAGMLAVAGRALDRHELASLDLRRPGAVAAEVADCGLFISTEGRLGYRHTLLRDAAYVDLADPVRLAMHERIGRMLAHRDVATAAESARHLQEAGLSQEAVEQLKIAAAHARTLAALHEAADLLRRAAELAPTDFSLLVDSAEIEALRWRADSSDALFDRALPGLSSPVELATAWARRASWYRGGLCFPHRVLDAARRAVAILDEADLAAPEIRLESMSQWAWAEAVAGDPAVAEEVLRQVHTLLPRGADDNLIPTISHARAFTLVRRGLFKQSYAPQIAAAEASRRIGRPDLAYGAWINAACAATCAQEFDRALEFIDRGLDDVTGHGLFALEVHLLAGRAHLLARLGRADEARSAAAKELAVAERPGDHALVALASHDAGLLALGLEEPERAVGLLAAAIDQHAAVSRPQLRLAYAEALIRLGRWDEAEAQLRRATLEPMVPGDLPRVLVPRLTWLQGLVARGRNDEALAQRRLHEAADGWQRLATTSNTADDFVAVLADFGRPPIVGLVEPARELARVRADLHQDGRGQTGLTGSVDALVQ